MQGNINSFPQLSAATWFVFDRSCAPTRLPYSGLLSESACTFAPLLVAFDVSSGLLATGHPAFTITTRLYILSVEKFL